MARIKQSFCYPCFLRGDVDLETLIREAAGIGYAAVELWGREKAPFEEILDLASKHGLVVASMGGHNSLTDGLNKRENHDRIEQEILASIELAVAHRIPGLICFSGNRNGLDDERGAEIVTEGLDRVKKAAEENGISLNVELLNSKVNHPDYQCDHTPWGARVCEMVGSPRVKLLYDIYHMQIMEGDLIRTIRDNIQHIGHFHTAGNPDRRDLDEDQEIYYPAVMRAIADTGYDLYVAHEFTPKGDPLGALKTSFRLCDVE